MEYSYEYDNDYAGYEYEGFDDLLNNIELEDGSHINGKGADKDFVGGLLGGLFGGAIVAFILAYLAVIAVVALIQIIGTWKVYTKASKPGWASIIPIYSNWVLFEAVGMEGWYSLLVLIPFLGWIPGVIFTIMALIKLPRCFGHSDGFAVGLILLPVVFFPILGFDKSVYTAPEIEKKK